MVGPRRTAMGRCVEEHDFTLQRLYAVQLAARQVLRHLLDEAGVMEGMLAWEQVEAAAEHSFVAQLTLLVGVHEAVAVVHNTHVTAGDGTCDVREPPRTDSAAP